MAEISDPFSGPPKKQNQKHHEDSDGYSDDFEEESMRQSERKQKKGGVKSSFDRITESIKYDQSHRFTSSI
jgi:hypothetical protein